MRCPGLIRLLVIRPFARVLPAPEKVMAKAEQHDIRFDLPFVGATELLARRRRRRRRRLRQRPRGRGPRQQANAQEYYDERTTSAHRLFLSKDGWALQVLSDHRKLLRGAIGR